MKFGYWLPAIALAVLIFVFSGMEKPPQPEMGVDFGDKILHFIVYGFLCAFILIGMHSGRARKKSKKLLYIAIVIASLYGVSDEFHQSFVEGRSSDVADWLADTIGAFAGAYLFQFVSGISLRKERIKIRNNHNDV